MAKFKIYSNFSPDIGGGVGVVSLDVAVELGLGPEHLAAGLTGELLAQVDLVVDCHVTDLAVVAHVLAADVAYETLLLPLLDLGHLHVGLSLGQKCRVVDQSLRSTLEECKVQLDEQYFLFLYPSLN